jgi:hypothetical protein
MVRLLRLLVPVAAALVVFAGCSGPNPYQAARESTTTVAGSGTQGTAVGDNPFLPDKNLSDCVGTNERPNCGSPEKGTKGTYMTFAVLIAGLGFIFWRISIGVRARDKVMNADPEPSPTPTPDTGD